jgi:hypothetical protein
MKQLLQGGMVAALLTVGLGTAYATAELELVSGGDTLFVTDQGAITCTGGTCASFGASGDNNPLVGAVAISATDFNGWLVTLSSGSSNSPGCPAIGLGPGCLNDTNINAQTTGAGTLSVYFGDSGFATETGFNVAFSSPLQTGAMATQTAYAYTGALSLLTPSGQIGSVLSSPAPGVAALATAGPGLTGPFNLELQTVFTTTGPGAFNANGNITAVPEPATVLLFGTVLLICATIWKRKKLAR